MSMRRLSVFAASCLLAGTVLAAPPSRQEIDPELRADIQRLLDVTGASDLGKKLGAVVSEQIMDMLKEQNPQLPPRAFEISKEVMAEEYAKAFDGSDGILSDLTDIYARYFTREEIQTMIEYNTSEVGQKVIRVMPDVFRDSMQVGRDWAEEIAPRMQRAVQARLEKEGLLESTDTVKGADIP